MEDTSSYANRSSRSVSLFACVTSYGEQEPLLHQVKSDSASCPHAHIPGGENLSLRMRRVRLHDTARSLCASRTQSSGLSGWKKKCISRGGGGVGRRAVNYKGQKQKERGTGTRELWRHRQETLGAVSPGRLNPRPTRRETETRGLGPFPSLAPLIAARIRTKKQQ